MNKKEKIAAIPTMYNGIQFRSRLEAKWACFFDLLNFSWEYEPIDLNGWIPDFILKISDPLFVEVKPVKTLDELEQYYEKTILSGYKGEVLFVGSIINAFYDTNNYEIGRLLLCDNESYNSIKDFEIINERKNYGAEDCLIKIGDKYFNKNDDNAVLFGCYYNGYDKSFDKSKNHEKTKYGIVAECGSFHCRVCGEHYKAGPSWDVLYKDEINDLWKKATNIIQWRRPK